MKILHLTDHYPPVLGGIETHVEALARRQSAGGADVSVLTISPADADGRHSDDRGPVTVHRVRSAAEGRRVDPTAYDVVHAHVSVLAPFTAPLAASAARRGVPTLVTVHSLWSGLGPVPAVAAALAGLRTAPVLWTAVSGSRRPSLPLGSRSARRSVCWRTRSMCPLGRVPMNAPPTARSGW
jgi:glycosyltransferase involved in cell wall biosynthesis